MSVYTDEARTEKFDEFTAAVGYEILAEDIEKLLDGIRPSIQTTFIS